jgi:hypothetical protein
MPVTPPHPNRPEKSKHDGPAVLVSPRCPNCGRENVVVFSVPPPNGSPPDETHRLVCLQCCPKAPSESEK